MTTALYSDSEVEEYISEILAETRWHDKHVTLPDFLSGFTSAQPVRLVPQRREVDLGEADFMHPFLAFSRRRRTKVYAENLVWDAESKKYVPTGPPLEIPKDYLGWFELIKQGAPMGQACQNTIGGVVNTKCKQFLLRTTVIGYLASETSDQKAGDFQVGDEVRIYPGEIVEIKQTVSKKWKTQSVDGRTPTSPKTKAPVAETKFAECQDAKGRTVYLPLAHPGQFYGLWSSDMSKTQVSAPRLDLAYYIYDMLNFGFPFLAKVVFGWPPADFPEFSGFLRILGQNRPDSLILRSMKPGSCVILELPMDADVRVEKMANFQSLNGNRNYERILSHSCDRIYPYLIGMKHMDTRYPVVQTESTQDSNRDNCRMARPRDMNTFNAMAIFPPLDEPIRKVSDSWTLSFKDPVHMSELKDSESVLVDPESDPIDRRNLLGPSRQMSVSGSRSGGGGVNGNKQPISGPKRHENFWHRRADMEQVLLDREAEC